MPTHFDFSWLCHLMQSDSVVIYLANIHLDVILTTDNKKQTGADQHWPRPTLLFLLRLSYWAALKVMGLVHFCYSLYVKQLLAFVSWTPEALHLHHVISVNPLIVWHRVPFPFDQILDFVLFLAFCSFVTVQSPSWVSSFGSSLVRLLYPAEDGKSTLSLISSSAGE